MHTLDTKLRFTGNSSPLTQNYICGVGTTVLCLGIVTTGAVTRTGGAPTFNGIVLTQADQTRQYTANPETSCELWYLLNPPTVTTYQISIPNTGSKTLQVVISSYKAQTGYSSVLDVSGGGIGFGYNPSVSVTTTVNGDVIVGVLGYGEDYNPTTQNGTVLFSNDNGLYSDNNQYYLQTFAGSQSLGWTTSVYGGGIYGQDLYNGGEDWCICVAAFKETFVGNKIISPYSINLTTAVSTPAYDKTKPVSVSSLTLSVKIPTINIDGNVSFVAASTSLTSTIYQPANIILVSNNTILPSKIDLTATLPTTSVIININHEPTSISLTLTVYAPTVKLSSNVLPSTLYLTTTVLNGSILINQDRYINPDELILTTTVLLPNILSPLPIIRMISFIYSTSIAYMMEFGEEYVRFYYNGEPLLSGDTHVEITTPYQHEDLLQLDIRQVGDTMWITHPLYAQRKLTRTTATSFALTKIPFKKGPFLTRNDIENDDKVTMTCNETLGGVAGILTCSSAIFESGHVESLFSLLHPRVNLKTEGTLAAFVRGIIGEAIEVYGDYTFAITTTNWSGSVRLQRSTNGITYTDVTNATFTGKVQTFTGTEIVEEVFYRINVITHTTGTISASLVVNTATVTGSITTVGVIKVPLKVPQGDFTFNTHGTWAATVVLERNENDAGWEAYRTFVGDSDRNVQFSGTENEDNVRYRINVTAYTSGTVKADLTATASTIKGIVKIDSIISTTQANVTVLSEIGSATPTIRWAEGAWSGVRGYPTSVTFFEDRCVYAGKINGVGQLPVNVWPSKTGDYEDFEEDVKDSDSFMLGVPSTNALRWIEAAESLLLGTSGDEWKLGTNKLEGALTPTNFSVKQQLSYGSNYIQAIKVNDVIMFVDSLGRKVRECVFNNDVQKLVAPDLTAFSEHITFSGITCIAHQKNPDSILWCVLANGGLISMTYVREQNVISWARHPMDGIVQSVAIIPSTTEDEIWISVVRAIGGETEVYIEQFQPRYYGVRKEQSFFVDSGITYNGVAKTVITGLNHLEGKEVSILADGVEQERQIVSSGSITLSTAARLVQVGLPYTSRVQPMRMDVNTTSGSSLGSKKKISELVLSFVDTVSAKYGVSTTALFEIDWTNIEWTNSSIIDGLFTGDVVVVLDGGFSSDDPILISSDSPLPMNLRAIIARMDITSR